MPFVREFSPSRQPWHRTFILDFTVLRTWTCWWCYSYCWRLKSCSPATSQVVLDWTAITSTNKNCLTLRFAPWSIICLNQNLSKWNLKGNLISKIVIEKLPGSHMATGGHHGPHEFNEWTTSDRWFQTSNVWHLPHHWSHPENVKKNILNMISQMYVMDCYGYSWIFVCAFWSRLLFWFPAAWFFHDLSQV